MMMMMMMMLMGSYQTPSPLLQAVMRLLTFLAIFLYSFNRRSESISGQSENHHSSLAQVNIYPKHEVVKHGDAAFQSVAWICAKPPPPARLAPTDDVPPRCAQTRTMVPCCRQSAFPEKSATVPTDEPFFLCSAS